MMSMKANLKRQISLFQRREKIFGGTTKHEHYHPDSGLLYFSSPDSKRSTVTATNRNADAGSLNHDVKTI